VSEILCSRARHYDIRKVHVDRIAQSKRISVANLESDGYRVVRFCLIAPPTRICTMVALISPDFTPALGGTDRLGGPGSHTSRRGAARRYWSSQVGAGGRLATVVDCRVAYSERLARRSLGARAEHL